jgi:hypothetical protein
MENGNEQREQSHKEISVSNAENKEPELILGDLAKPETVLLQFDDGIYGAVDIGLGGFIVNRHELILIAKYWATLRVSIYFDSYIDQFDTHERFQQRKRSKECFLLPYADSQVCKIAEFLGDETVLKIVIEAETIFSKTVDDFLWEGFVQDDKQRPLFVNDYRKAPLLHKVFWDLDQYRS